MVSPPSLPPPPQAIEEYVQFFYGHYFRPGAELETVSVHLRLGYSHGITSCGLVAGSSLITFHFSAEPAKSMLSERDMPTRMFYEKAFKSFDRARVQYLVFSDDLARARDMFAPLIHYGFKIVFVDENVVVSIRLMSLCTHHILTSSTLSFWGAYLDERQPTGGRTILPQSFFKEHGRDMIPYSSWEVL